MLYYPQNYAQPQVQQPQKPKVDQKAKLSINFTKGWYYTDEHIKGTVELNTSTGYYLNDINFYFNKIESWSYKDGENVVKESDKQTLFSCGIGIKKNSNINTDLVHLGVGVSHFPIDYRIQKLTVPSFEYPGTVSASIKYEIELKIASPYSTENFSTLILIRARPRLSKQNQKFSFSCNTSLHKWGLFSSGDSKFVVTLLSNKDNYTCDEQCQMSVDIDNYNGKINAKECKLVLNRFLQFKSKYGKVMKVQKDYCISRVFDTQTSAGDKKQYTCSLDFKDIKNNMFQKNHHIPYQNIDLIQLIPSIESSLISCKYIIKVTLYFNNFVPNKDRPRVKIPILFVHQNYEVYKGLIAKVRAKKKKIKEDKIKKLKKDELDLPSEDEVEEVNEQNKINEEKKDEDENEYDIPDEPEDD